MKKIIALACAVMLMAGVAVVLGNSVAHAQGMPCAPYKEVVEGLKRNHNERPAGLGQGQRDMAVLLFRTPSGSTWTLVIVRPDGVACLVAEGQAWSDIAVPGDPA